MDTFTIILFIILAVILLIFVYFYKSSILGLFGYTTKTNTNNNTTNTNNTNNNNTNTKIEYMETLAKNNKETYKKKNMEATIDNISQFSLPSFNEKEDNLSFLNDTISKESKHDSLFLT